MQNLFNPNTSYGDLLESLLSGYEEPQMTQAPGPMVSSRPEYEEPEFADLFTKINPDIDTQADALKKQIELNQSQKDRALSNINDYSQKLLFDPVKATNEQYLDLYKWKGATKGQKAKSIFTGVLDALNIANSGVGLRGQIEARNQREFENIQKVYPQLLQNERLVAQNANSGITTLLQEQQKTLREQEKNRTLIESKKMLAELKSTEARNKFKTELAKLDAMGELNAAKAKQALANAKKLEMQAITPNSDQALISMVTRGDLDENAFNKLMDLRKAAKSNRVFSPRVLMEPEKVEVRLDPVSGNVVAEPFRSGRVYDPNTNSELPSPFEKKATGKLYSPAEAKSIQDLISSNMTLRNATTTLIDDMKTGKSLQNTGLNEVRIKDSINRLFETDPSSAAARAMMGVTASLGTLQHIKGLYGSRPPESLMQDLEMLVEGRKASDIQKAAALASQALTVDLYLHEKANNPLALTVARDPMFYNFIKANMTAYITAAKGGQNPGNLPTINELITQFMKRKLAKNDSGKTSAEVNSNDAKKNPIAAEALRQKAMKILQGEK